MDNKTIYKKTLGFSLRRLFWDFISLILIAGIATLGFFIAEKQWDKGLIGLLIGLLVGIIIIAIITHFFSYALKAGQIAMMTKGVTGGDLSGNVIAEGKQMVRQRFKTVAVYFALTGAIKGIFRQLSKGITRLGEAVGGDVGGAVGGTIGSVIETIIAYLCDCCLGWVFYRKEVSSVRATCEGAVIFFKHGKTFAKNMGRVFGIGLLSFILIGGAVGGITYLILSTQSGALSGLYNEIAQAVTGTGFIADLLRNPATIPAVFAIVGGIIVWSFIHSTFIKPFVLVGVLRNYIESGKNDVPSEASFSALDSKSPKFKKLHEDM